MIIGFTRTVTLPSGNLARNFHAYALSDGRVRIQYVYTDRRRNHQVARYYTADFMNGHVYSIQARSANGNRVEFFSTSSIIDELLEMLNEFNETAKRDAMIEETETEQDADSVAVADDTINDSNAITDLKDDIKFLWGIEIIHLIFTLVILLILWYNV